MTGTRDPDEGMTQPTDPPSDQYWPARDLRDRRRVEMSEADTSVEAGPEWDVRRHGDRRRSTTAEQAVPWLIAIILALAGMVIVLLALIFTNGGALSGPPGASPVGIVDGAEPSASGVPVGSGSPTTRPTPSASATPSVAPTVTPTPAPSYPPLAMTYLSRKSASSPVYLARRDFAKKVDPTELAIADQGIASFAWAPDGTVGAALIGGSTGRVVAIEPDSNKRALIDGADEISFGQDASTLFAVKITTSGGKDKAEVLSIDFASGDTKSLTDFTYPHPQIFADPLLTEAAFDDEGGIVRLYPTTDGNLVLWILGAPATYRIDPADGTRTEVTRAPTLWSPDGKRRVETKLSGSTTTLTLKNRDGESQASVKVSGLVSHLRWSADNSEVAFTLGHLGHNGGVSQDLFVWALQDGVAPLPITSNGTSFGAEWLGASQSWEP
ncbi:MAG TPA: hypothetical protein VFX74_01525 [Candidatus Limnocylindria bacterium]|nr:hypothetical protein [Candidatus Limnocylindria bacterium]